MYFTLHYTQSTPQSVVYRCPDCYFVAHIFTLVEILTTMGNGYDLNSLLHEAKSRWLMPDQLLFIIQNHEPWMIQKRVHQKPASGSLVLFNRKDVHSFRGDGHIWRKRANRNTVKEGHENLKVGGVHALACYYAHGADNPNFCRRIYWMMENKDIVLVHYLNNTEFSMGQSRTIPRSPIEVETGVADKAAKSFEVEMSRDRLLQELLDQNYKNGKQFISFGGQSMHGIPAFGCDNSGKELDQGANLQQGEYSGRDDVMTSGLNDPFTWQKTASQNLEECLERTLCENNISDSHPGQAQMPLGVLQEIPEQKFIIRNISPDWCFASDITKVIVVGTFSCDPSETICAMFGNIEVPAQIIQDGVICCEAPSNCPGKVTFCITSGNREFYSEVKEFEYRDSESACKICSKLQQEEERRMEEAKLLVEFVGMLSSSSSLQKGETDNFCSSPLRMHKGYEYATGYSTEALLRGRGTSFGIIDWVLQEVLKEKLQVWLATRLLEVDYSSSCMLSKKERGIIHLVAGLGYEWALNPILDSGVGVNFRDANGWTALHWAARFGREKIVCALITCGALVSAVTDPTAQDPMCKNAASIAEANGHESLAAYLSAFALTTRFSAFEFEEAQVEVSNTWNEFNEDEIRMKQVLIAKDKGSNSKAAELQHTVVRVHSFTRKKQRKEAANRGEADECGLTCDEMQHVSAAMFKNKNVAALTIQKYYMDRKRHNHFQTVRDKVVKIQAHVRGYQIRKYYRATQAVSTVSKVILRCRRERCGLRGFKLPGGEAMDENKEEEDEDILLAEEEEEKEAQGQYAFDVAVALDLDSINGAVLGKNDTAHDIDALQDTPASPDCLKLSCLSFLKFWVAALLNKKR